MADPEQTDLIDYLAGGAAQGVPLSPAFRSNQRGELACVHFEHTRQSAPNEGRAVSTKPATTAAPMSSHRLLVCLIVLGWSERELVRRTGRLQTTARRWTGGQVPVLTDVAAWVEALAALVHSTDPGRDGPKSQAATR